MDRVQYRGLKHLPFNTGLWHQNNPKYSPNLVKRKYNKNKMMVIRELIKGVNILFGDMI